MTYMKKKCGNCLNLYTFDCPRPEASYYDEDICSLYSKGYESYVDENGHIVDWSDEDGRAEI